MELGFGGLEVSNANLDLFNSWMNRITSKYLSQTPKEKYTATVDLKDVLRDEVSGIYSESQKNKPSPVSPYTYNELAQILPKKFPRSWGIERSFIGWTNSMEPTFDHGDLCVRMPYKEWKQKLKGKSLIGQIAIYNYGNSRIIHRCVAKLSDGRWVFKGDNNFRADPPVKDEDVVDVMIGVIHTRTKLDEQQD